MDEFNDFHMNSDDSDEHSDDSFKYIYQVPEGEDGWSIDALRYDSLQLHRDDVGVGVLRKLKIQISAMKTRMLL